MSAWEVGFKFDLTCSMPSFRCGLDSIPGAFPYQAVPCAPGQWQKRCRVGKEASTQCTASVVVVLLIASIIDNLFSPLTQVKSSALSVPHSSASLVD
eukprot:6157296-Amphidinium_carterae.2